MEGVTHHYSRFQHQQFNSLQRFNINLSSDSSKLQHQQFFNALTTCDGCYSLDPQETCQDSHSWWDDCHPLAADQTPSRTGHELFQVWEPVSHGAEARLVLLEVPFQRLSDFHKREKQQLFSRSHLKLDVIVELLRMRLRSNVNSSQQSARSLIDR